MKKKNQVSKGKKEEKGKSRDCITSYLDIWACALTEYALN